MTTDASLWANFRYRGHRDASHFHLDLEFLKCSAEINRTYIVIKHVMHWLCAHIFLQFVDIQGHDNFFRNQQCWIFHSFKSLIFSVVLRTHCFKLIKSKLIHKKHSLFGSWLCFSKRLLWHCLHQSFSG